MTITAADIKIVYPRANGISDSDITAMITMVGEIFDTILSDCGYSATLIDNIKKYLTAHYLSLGHDQGGLLEKKTGESEERYRDISLNTTATGLALTPYGQQALSLDINGCLSNHATAIQKAEFRVI